MRSRREACTFRQRPMRRLEELAVQIATWNVNSVRQRMEHLLGYLKDVSPDVLCLQEIKCVDEAFPRLEVEALGYNVATHGQKGFNGVAILSKTPDRGDARPARRSLRRTCPIYRGDCPGRARASCGLPASICPTAIRRTPINTPISLAGWTGSSRMPKAAGLRGAAGLCRRL